MFIYNTSFYFQGDLIYVNYAEEDDFLLLKNTYNVTFTNKIVIARYGKIYRGNKV